MATTHSFCRNVYLTSLLFRSLLSLATPLQSCGSWDLAAFSSGVSFYKICLVQCILKMTVTYLPQNISTMPTLCAMPPLLPISSRIIYRHQSLAFSFFYNMTNTFPTRPSIYSLEKSTFVARWTCWVPFMHRPFSFHFYVFPSTLLPPTSAFWIWCVLWYWLQMRWEFTKKNSSIQTFVSTSRVNTLASQLL